MWGGGTVFRGSVIIVAGVWAITWPAHLQPAVVITLHAVFTACGSRATVMGLREVEKAAEGM